MVEHVDDLQVVRDRLHAILDDIRGKLRSSDALRLAGFASPTFQRSRIVALAMKELGWERVRVRFQKSLLYAYARGSLLEREAILDVEHGNDGLIVTRREP